MSEDQMNLVSWVAVQDEIDRSVAEIVGDRIHWDVYFKRSLNKTVADLTTGGMSRQEVFKYLSDDLCSKGVTNAEVFRKLYIGVCARTSEAASHDKQRRHVLHRTCKICEYCNGTGKVQD